MSRILCRPPRQPPRYSISWTTGPYEARSPSSVASGSFQACFQARPRQSPPRGSPINLQIDTIARWWTRVGRTAAMLNAARDVKKTEGPSIALGPFLGSPTRRSRDACLHDRREQEPRMHESEPDFVVAQAFRPAVEEARAGSARRPPPRAPGSRPPFDTLPLPRLPADSIFASSRPAPSRVSSTTRIART